MNEFNRRQALKLLVGALSASVIPGCTCLAGRVSHCDHYKFDQIDFPVIDMHAHFFNATDLLAVEYVTGPVINDFAGDRYNAIRQFLTRVANAIYGLITLKGKLIDANAELKWLNSNQACSPEEEYDQLSKEFFDLVTEEDRKQTLSFTKERTSIPFVEILNLAAAEIEGGFLSPQKIQYQQAPSIRFDEKTLLNAVMGRSLYDQGKNLDERFAPQNKCPADPGFFSRVFTFVARVLVRRSTNIQAYYDRYSRQPVNRYGIRHVMNIGCDFDFFLESCRDLESSISDQIRVNEKLYEHTNGFAIPVLGVNPWKMYHEQSYADLVDRTLARGIYRGVKLYPSIGYSVTGEFRKGITDHQCNLKGINKDILKQGMNLLFDILVDRQAYVTSHTTYSKGGEPGAEALAAPAYWKEIICCRPELRVNFGHMGDTDGRIGPEWRQGFLELMRDYDNVYADFGYHEYTDYPTLKADLMELKSQFGESIFTKITYGTDWFMISKDKGANAYLCDTTRSFERAVSEEVIKDLQLKDILHDNASRFLNL